MDMANRIITVFVNYWLKMVIQLTKIRSDTNKIQNESDIL